MTFLIGFVSACFNISTIMWAKTRKLTQFQYHVQGFYCQDWKNKEQELELLNRLLWNTRNFKKLLLNTKAAVSQKYQIFNNYMKLQCKFNKNKTAIFQYQQTKSRIIIKSELFSFVSSPIKRFDKVLNIGIILHVIHLIKLICYC